MSLASDRLIALMPVRRRVAVTEERRASLIADAMEILRAARPSNPDLLLLSEAALEAFLGRLITRASSEWVRDGRRPWSNAAGLAADALSRITNPFCR